MTAASPGCGGSTATPDAGPPAVDAAVDAAEGPIRLTADEVMSRPTASSVTVSVVAGEPIEAYLEARRRPSTGDFDLRGPTAQAGPDQTAAATLTSLPADTAFDLRLRVRRPGAATFEVRPTGTFHTARPAGQPFTFTVQADSHLDEKSNLDLYRQTLRNVVADRADFHIDLGDTFMTDKHSMPLVATVMPAADEPTVIARYLYERQNYALLGLAVPLVLVNGNHDGESGWRLTGGENPALWAARARKRFFPNPTADGFVSAPAQDVPGLGPRDAAFAFTWGDALVVGLDPYWWTANRAGGGENWGWTLGDAQYRWLEQVLTTSRARYKLVFIHHLVGGLGNANRGGIEAAGLYEWGGRNADGSDGFAAHRPGWARPIHDLLVATHVTAVVHGHDHLYAYQQKDGLVYLEVPQPSNPNGRNFATLATEGGYVSGTFLGSSGHVRFSVAPDQLRVDYVRSSIPGVGEQVANGSVTHTWTAAPWIAP